MQALKQALIHKISEEDSITELRPGTVKLKLMREIEIGARITIYHSWTHSLVVTKSVTNLSLLALGLWLWSIALDL